MKKEGMSLEFEDKFV